MPSGDGRWAELSSQNERVIRPGDPEATSAGGQARWADLDSSGERLANDAERPSGVTPSRLSTGMRLVAGAA